MRTHTKILDFYRGVQVSGAGKVKDSNAVGERATWRRVQENASLDGNRVGGTTRSHMISIFYKYFCSPVIVLPGTYLILNFSTAQLLSPFVCTY